jgi:hypothetical protein
VAHDRPVGKSMLVPVRKFVVVIVGVIVPAVRPVNMLVLVCMIMVMVVFVFVHVHGAVGMPMHVPVAFDLRFAAAAPACRAHTVLLGPPQAISISFTRISSPCVTCNW